VTILLGVLERLGALSGNCGKVLKSCDFVLFRGLLVLALALVLRAGRALSAASGISWSSLTKRFS